MENLEYDDFTEQLKKINEKMEDLENTDRLQEYLQLQKQSSALQENIYKSCKHILVYSKIKQAYPNVDDAIAIKYFKNVLDNIRDNKFNKGRQVSRAKRLSLNSNFKHWNERYSSN